MKTNMESNHHHQDTTAFATDANSSGDAARGTKRKHDDDEENRAYQAVLRCLMDLYEDDPPREDDNTRAAMYTSDGVAPAIIYDSELRYHQAAAPDDDEESVDQDQARQAVLRCLMDLYEDDPTAEHLLPRVTGDNARGAIAPAIIYDSKKVYRRAAAAATDLPSLAVPCHKKRKTNRGLQKTGRRRTMYRLPICRNTTVVEVAQSPSFVRDCQQEENIGVIDLTATDDEQEQGGGNQDKTNAINYSNAAALYDNEDEESEMQEEEEDHDEDDDEDVDNCNEEVEAFEEHPDSAPHAYDRLWEENFQRLVAYKQKHKTTKVPFKYPVLGNWVSKQRSNFETMSNYRKQRLNSIGFVWDGKQLDQQWEENFQRLVVYKEKHKTTNVPSRESSLGIWVKRQRSEFENMSDYRKQRLNSIGFVWDGKQFDKQWEENFQRLVVYKEKHKTTNVPYKEGSLGEWVQTQRKKYRKDEMSNYRKQRLNSIGFKWDGKHFDEQWEDKFQLLVAYKEKHKTTKVPRSEGSLGFWVKRQRENFKEMPDCRKQKLNSIGFEWKIKKKMIPWADMYTSLVAYYYHHDTTIVSKEDDPRLCQWVQTQRRHCKDPHKISLLNDIGFQWSLKRKDTILL